MRYIYPCDIVPDTEEDGWGFLVSFPDVYGAHTGAKTYEKSLFMAEDCLTAALGGYVRMGWDLPAPSPVAEGQELVAVPPMEAAKLSIYTAMRRQGVTREFLAQQLGLRDATVDKLLVPDRYSPWSQITRALDLLGRKLVVEDNAA